MKPAVADIERLMSGIEGAAVTDGGPGVVVHLAHDAVPGALEVLAGAGYESLTDLFGTDTGEAIEVTYHVRSYAQGADAFLKCVLPYDACLGSVWEIYPSALMPERETAELLGLRLSGHPNPKRLFTTDGVEPLLRKSVAIRGAGEYHR